MYCLPRTRFAEWILDQIAELMSGIIWLYIILFWKVLLNVVEGIDAMCCAPWPWIHHPASRLKSSLVILDRWKFTLQTYFILQSMSDSKKKYKNVLLFCNARHIFKSERNQLLKIILEITQQSCLHVETENQIYILSKVKRIKNNPPLFLTWVQRVVTT